MKKSPQLALIPLIIIMLCGIAMGFLWLPAIYSYAFAGLCAVMLIVAFALLSKYKKNMEHALDDIFLENLSASSKIIGQIEIPAVLIDDKGFVIWANPAFGRLYGGKDIRRVLDGFDPKYPQKATAAQLNGRDFMVMSMPVERMHERAQQLTFQYWLDRTEAIHYSRLYEEHMPVVALIYVDNYDELSADKHFLKNAVLGDVEKLVSKLVTDIEGTYRRYDNTRFMVFFEAVKLAELEKSRFSLLDAARDRHWHVRAYNAFNSGGRGKPRRPERRIGAAEHGARIGARRRSGGGQARRAIHILRRPHSALNKAVPR